MSARSWRICKAEHAHTAFTGEGARRAGGRWNSRGSAVVYTARSPSLAVLEMLVNLDHHQLQHSYRICQVSFDESLVERLDLENLPKDWRQSPPPAQLQEMGDQWVREARSAVWRVPSAVLDLEHNYILNPQHPDFMKIEIGEMVAFQFDSRLTPL